MVDCARKPGPPVTREFNYLLASVQQFFVPETELPPTEGLDWKAVLRLANGHAVMPFLCRSRQCAEVEDRVRETVRVSLTLSAELVKLLDVFEKQGITVIPLKGPVLSASLYGDQVLRTSTDLDLLVRPSDVLRTKSVLERIGYRLESVLHWHADSACFQCRDGQFSFSDLSGRVSIDVHWQMLPRYFPAPFDEAEVWRNLRSTQWAGRQVWTLAPAHLFQFLCAHGTRHLWDRLGWICDVARMLQIESGIEWSDVIRQASQTNTLRMVSLALLLASDLLGARLPPAMAERVTGDARARSLAATLTDRLRAGTPVSAVDTALLSVRALERTSYRARLIFGIFVQPTEAEYHALQLPPGLHWLYYLIRPVRLAGKYTQRLIGP
jgi:hypothetical protein